MSKLLSNTPYDGFSQISNGLCVKELSEFEIASLAVAQNSEAEFNTIFKTLTGTALPEPGRWSKIKTGKILWTGQSQYFYFSDRINDRLDDGLNEAFEGHGYVTLQSDGWAALEVSGDRVHDVMERFIALDVRNQDIGFGARSSAHHIGVFILKIESDTYHLLTPRSSSKGFLEALLHVVENVEAENTAQA